jgi:hypothetical protein
MTVLNLAGLFQCLAFGCDALQRIVPGLVERLGPLTLELRGKGVDVDAESVRVRSVAESLRRSVEVDMAVPF